MHKKDQIVSFRIGKEHFGVPIDAVQEIVRVPEITAVPEMPPFVEGVINLRGRIVSIIDLSRRLKIQGGARVKTSRILIVEIDRKVIGLLVDAVSAILRIPPEAIEPAPEIVASVGAEYITGVGKLPDKLVLLLDLTNILKPEEVRKIAAEERAGTQPPAAPAAPFGAAA